MKKYIFYLVFCFGMFASVAAQDLNDYRYVRVPERFEFSKEDNQFQLNALTAFLLEKKGFTALYKKGIPQGVDPCEVLTVNVHNESNLFRSRLYVTLEDCNNQTVFTSQTGSSKEKEYQVSYHEALREAFASIEELNYNPNVAEKNTSGINAAENEQIPEVIIDPAITSEGIEKVAAKEISSRENKISSQEDQIQKFLNGPNTYILMKSAVGYDLFKEGQQEKFAGLMKSGGGDNYLYSSKNVSGNAFFDTHGNLVVEYLDPNSQQLVTITYKLQAQ